MRVLSIRLYAALIIAGLSIWPAHAQTDLRTMTKAKEAAARSASDPAMEATVRREYQTCVTEERAKGEEKAFECNGILAFAFEEARRRKLRALSEWAVRGITGSIYDEVDASTPLTLMGEAAQILSQSDYPKSLPFHTAYVEDSLADPKAGQAVLDLLLERADRYDRFGYPASEAIYAAGAATLAQRMGVTQTQWRMHARALRARAMLAQQGSATVCAPLTQPAEVEAETRLHIEVSCAIAIEQEGRWREAEARLRELLPRAQAQASPQARADLLLALGRNLSRQELYDAAIPYLTAARDLLAPLSSEEDERLLRMPAILAARAQGALNIATGFRDLRPSGVHRYLSGIYKLEAQIAAADTWAFAAEQLQRRIDSGSLRWEGGVWRQMLTAYGTAADDAARYLGRDAPMVGMLKAKDVQGQEQFLTEGFRRALTRDYIEDEMIADMDKAVGLIATLPVSSRYRIDGFKVAAAFMGRNRRDVPRARTLCRSAMNGALENMRSHAEFDAAAQAQIRRRAPLFVECAKIAWLAATPATP